MRKHYCVELLGWYSLTWTHLNITFRWNQLTRKVPNKFEANTSHLYITLILLWSGKTLRYVCLSSATESDNWCGEDHGRCQVSGVQMYLCETVQNPQDRRRKIPGKSLWRCTKYSWDFHTVDTVCFTWWNISWLICSKNIMSCCGVQNLWMIPDFSVNGQVNVLTWLDQSYWRLDSQSGASDEKVLLTRHTTVS